MKQTLLAAAFFGVVFFVVFSVPAPSAANDEAFFQMVQSDDIAGVEAAIAEGQDVNARDRMGRTPLFLVSGDVRIAQVLIRAGADVNAGFGYQTPLHKYAFSRADMVEVLLAASADVNAADNGGYTPLHFAVTILMKNPKEKLRIAQMLLDAGADVNAGLQDGTTPLIQASLAAVLAQDNDVQRMVEMLLKAGADVKAKDAGSGMSALHWWSNQGKPGVIRLLLEAGADVDAKTPDGATPLMMAVAAPDNVRILEMLIEAGADVNAMSEGMTALRLAAVLGKTEDVSILLKGGARQERAPGGLTPLHLAAGVIAAEREGIAGSFEERATQATRFFLLSGQEFRPDFLGVSKLLAEAGANIDAKSDKSLKDVFTLSTGIRGENLDYRQFEDKTPLEFARIVGNEEVAKYLSEVSSRRRK